MKIKSLVFVLLAALGLSSCFSHHYNVGEGIRVEKTTEIVKKNNFLLWGVIPVQRAKIEEMVGDTINYHVYTRATPEDMIVSTLTLGIYTPTTTTVTIPAERYRGNTNSRVIRRD